MNSLIFSVLFILFLALLYHNYKIRAYEPIRLEYYKIYLRLVALHLARNEVQGY